MDFNLKHSNLFVKQKAAGPVARYYPNPPLGVCKRGCCPDLPSGPGHADQEGRAVPAGQASRQGLWLPVQQGPQPQPGTSQLVNTLSNTSTTIATSYRCCSLSNFYYSQAHVSYSAPSSALFHDPSLPPHLSSVHFPTQFSFSCPCSRSFLSGRPFSPSYSYCSPANSPKCSLTANSSTARTASVTSRGCASPRTPRWPSAGG